MRRQLRGHTETIGERFERDRAALLGLPATPYEACEKISARVSLKRLRRPDVLTAEEFRSLLEALPQRERLLGTICATTGLRIGEVLGLKWEDINFTTHMADVLRSYSDGAIGPCKTEISEQPVPLDEIVLEGLQGWRQISCYPEPGDWIFASDHHFGKTPLWPDSLRTKILQPIARRVGITKRIGWHTFRRTYSSLLASTGNDVKVVQELMRHSKIFQRSAKNWLLEWCA